MDPSRRFQAVTLRAVDKMAEACSRALERLAAGGWLVVFATSSTEVEDWVESICTVFLARAARAAPSSPSG